MGKWRNVSGEERLVGFGCPVARIDADCILSVVPDADIAYAGQPDIWEPVDQAAEDAADEYAAAVAMFAPGDPVPA